MYSGGESLLGEKGGAGASYDNRRLGRRYRSDIPPSPSRRGTK